jgi:S1-C subfamily serine protease
MMITEGKTRAKLEKVMIYFGILLAVIVLTTTAIFSSLPLSAAISYSSISTQPSSPRPSNLLQGSSFVDIFNNLKNSTVKIVSTPSTFQPNLQMPNATESGTGFIYDKEGHIITANHIIGGAKIVDAILGNGDRYTANVVGSDPFNDIAIVKINLTKQNKTDNASFHPVTLGNSSKIRIGELILALGYPFGSKLSLSTGIVSQTEYLLTIPPFGFSMPDSIESDIIVNPGNSGGPLINMQGQVIGMVYGRLNPTGVPLGQFPGMTVAVPANTIILIAPLLIQKGNYVHPSLGLNGITLTLDLAQKLNSPLDLKGVLVNTIIRGGTADKAGVNGSIINKYGEMDKGDIVTAIDGRRITGIEEMISYVQGKKSVGDPIVFTVYRNGKILNLRTILQAFSS